MDRLDHLWVILSDGAVSCCNEPHDHKGPIHQAISADGKILSQLASVASSFQIGCTVLSGRHDNVDHVLKELQMVKCNVVVPADYDGECPDTKSQVVFESRQGGLDKGPRAGGAVLRVTQDDVRNLASSVIGLLGRYAHVSVRHPDVLGYGKEEFEAYSHQLREIGVWLLRRGDAWSRWRVDVLTDRFHLDDWNECGAGVRSLAMGPDGRLYLCPAAYRHRQASCGHITQGVQIAGRHLLTREYALPCRDACNAWHCSRCVFLNKVSTGEFCVPAENVCRLAHTEQAAQAWLASEAARLGHWSSQGLNAPSTPLVMDPYQVVRANKEIRQKVWQRLQLFSGRKGDLTSAMMLDILYSLRGRVDAIESCLRLSHYVIAADALEDDVLLFLRRSMVERYKDVVFDDDCPTVHEIEMKIHRATEGQANLQALGGRGSKAVAHS